MSSEIQTEYTCIRTLFACAVADMEAEGGNVYKFSRDLLRSTLDVHLELYGLSCLDQAVCGNATHK